MDFTDGLIDENTSLEKLSSVICGLLVISLPMGLLMAKAHQKKITRFILSVVATQFLTHVLIKFSKNPKITKNNKNPKNMFF
jgi:fumarate reductase subunit D